jgi:alpha-1,2-mannosyltransferase
MALVGKPFGFDPSIFRQTPDSTVGAAPCSPRRLAIIAILCAPFGVVAWMLYLWAFHGDAAQDWMVFYTAARAYLDGDLSVIFDGERFTAALNQRFAGWLSFPLNLHPWVYPPTFLLLFLPFGLLPPGISLLLFLLLGFAAIVVAALLYAGRGHWRWMFIFSLLLCPAVPFNVLTGQNAFFTSALLVGGFGLLNRRPALSGVLLGILSFKPQLWLMVPIALLAGGRWRTLLATGATATVMALASLAMFGPQIWQAWFELTAGVSGAYRAWLVAGRLNGQSVFACLSLLGAPSSIANIAQITAIAAATGFVYFVFRRDTRAELQLSGLLSATVLAAPHASASDAVLLAVAASSFFSVMVTHGLHPLRATVTVAVWVSPLFNPPSLFRVGLITPVLILLFLACVIAEIREQGEDSSAAPGLQAQRAF